MKFEIYLPTGRTAGCRCAGRGIGPEGKYQVFKNVKIFFQKKRLKINKRKYEIKIFF